MFWSREQGDNAKGGLGFLYAYMLQCNSAAVILLQVVRVDSKSWRPGVSQ
jgi:hypothetical protein